MTPNRPASDATTTPAAQAATRRRGEALEQAILDAAWDELVAVGYAEVTMAAVAARAGTSKPVLYRRWPNRSELIAAAIESRVPDLDPGPADTGSLRGDVIAVLEQAAGALSALGATDAELAAHLRTRTRSVGIDRLGAVLQRHGLDGLPPRIRRLPIDLLIAEPAPTADAAAEIVDEVFLPLVALRAR